MNDQLKQAAINAGAKLRAMNEAQDTFAREYTAWEVSHLRILTDRKDTKLEYEVALEGLRKAVLAEYEATGNKHPGAGTGIRVSQRVVVDEPVALKWAETNAPVMIKRALDRKAFVAYAKANPDSVALIARIDEEPTATIPSDLLSALEAAGLTLPDPPSVAFEPVHTPPEAFYTDPYGQVWGRDSLGRWAIISGGPATNETFWQHPQPPSIITGSGTTDPEPDDLLGPEPEVGRLPADPRDVAEKFEGDLKNAMGILRRFQALDTDALPRVDGPTIGGDK